jgi:hypothetical protein
LLNALNDVTGTPLGYITRLLEVIVGIMGMEWQTIRSSSLGIPEHVRGQDRIIAIAQSVGARDYVNAPGGRELYDDETFRRAGLSLRFLPEYRGPYSSILTRLLRESPETLKREIIENLGTVARA